MGTPIDKASLFFYLCERIGRHGGLLTEQLAPRSLPQLAWRPQGRTWSVLQCLAHLNLTHDYYAPKIAVALAAPAPVRSPDSYTPSFWGRIYMYFALNPRASFPSAEAIAPGDTLGRAVLAGYLDRQTQLLATLRRAEGVDLCRTQVPIAPGVRFNLGDCLKILVEHDALHLGQALRVLAATPQLVPGQAGQLHPHGLSARGGPAGGREE